MPASHHRPRSPALLGIAPWLLLAAPSVAQCTNPWQFEHSTAGVDGTVYALAVFDPDGAGPAPELWVVGGEFARAGNLSTTSIATFDPATRTWGALGSGANGRVEALCVLATGELVAGGDFTQIGGVAANRIARWNGTSWLPLGSGCDAPVRALAQRANGELIAGGLFGTAGGAPANAIASWNGSVWQPLGAGVDEHVFALAVRPNGEVVAGGSFRSAGGVSALNVASWNGNAWSALPAPSTPHPSQVRALLILPNGDVVAGGRHHLIGGNYSIARWNGSTWVGMPTSQTTTVSALALLPNGDLITGSSESLTGSWGVLERWNGNFFDRIDAPFGRYYALQALPGGGALFGGDVASPQTNGFFGVGRWDGSAVRGLAPAGGSPPQGVVRATAVRPNGNVLALCAPDSASWTPEVIESNGSDWTVVSRSGNLNTIAIAPNGGLFGGGSFRPPGFSHEVTGVGRWNGSAWVLMGSPMPNPPICLAVAPNGTIYAGCWVNWSTGNWDGVLRWTGSAWVPVGVGLLGDVNGLRFLANGDLVAFGGFQHDGNHNWMGRIARWNGSTWTPYGAGLTTVGGRILAVAEMPNGQLMIGGHWGSTPGSTAPTDALLARWNGAWTIDSVIGTEVSVLEPLPNGNVLVGGDFTRVNGMATNRVVRWTGSSWLPWSPFGSGLPAKPTTAVWRGGEVWLGGSFPAPGGIAAPAFARLSTTCPPSATSTGVACAGPSSTVVLQATSQPWIGTTLRSRAVGFAANELAIHVLGTSPVAVPLPAILPQGVLGCSLLASPEVLELRVPSGGAVDLAVPLSPLPAFAGFRLDQQVVVVGFSPLGDIVALTSSNGLVFIEGYF